MTRRRVLLVSYAFPPAGGAGVQRPAKFAKYLTELGWDVTVLQARNPSVPVMDPSLLDDLPSSVTRVEARTFEPGYQRKTGAASSAGTKSGMRRRLEMFVRAMARNLLLPDAQILWLPDAVRIGRQILRDTPHDVVLASAPAYSNLVIGAVLARQYHLPLVSDFRDEWEISTAHREQAARGRIAEWVSARLQRFVFRSSESLVATTEASAGRLRERARSTGSQASAVCIYNGWDADDLESAQSVAPVVPVDRSRFRFIYTGTLWNLTSIEPLVDAFVLMNEQRPDLASLVDLVVLGRRTPEQDAILSRLRGDGVTLHVREYVPHSEAIATMRSADVLILLLADALGAERVVPGKFFEYLALGRRMLTIAPEGELARLVRGAQGEGWFPPNDPTAIMSGITTLVEKWRADPAGIQVATPAGFVQRFTRRHLAGQLSDQLVSSIEAYRASRR